MRAAGFPQVLALVDVENAPSTALFRGKLAVAPIPFAPDEGRLYWYAFSRG